MATKTQLKKALKNPVQFLEENNGFPEVGFFTEKSDLQKFYKKLPTETLEEWAEVEGVEYKPNDHASIHRMRVAQAILFKHFPKPPAKPKTESPYKKYTTEELAQLALDKDVPVEPTEDLRILRMRLIMSLRAHKIVD